MYLKKNNLVLPAYCDVTAKFNEFNQTLGKVIDKFAQLKKNSRKQKRRKDKPWLS